MRQWGFLIFSQVESHVRQARLSLSRATNLTDRVVDQKQGALLQYFPLFVTVYFRSDSNLCR